MDAGPFRAFSDGANKQFLDEIGRGVVPTELEREAQGGELHVDLVDKRTTKYEPPRAEKPRVAAFTGSGHALGGPPAATAAAAAVAAGGPGGEMRAVDATRPTVSVQIRTREGGRVVGTFNADTHTVGDVLRVARAHGMAGTSLACNAPRRVFGPADYDLTLDKAQLGGAAVMLQ